MSWFVLMASWFSIKMLLLRSPFGFNTEKKYDEKKTGAMRNFEFRKHELYERWKSILKEILWQAIAASLNGIDELVLLLTALKKSWIYQLLSFIVSLRYFVNQVLHYWLRTWSFKTTWSTQDIRQEIRETDAL